MPESEPTPNPFTRFALRRIEAAIPGSRPPIPAMATTLSGMATTLSGPPPQSGRLQAGISGRLPVGTGGRLRSERVVALGRNPQATSSVTAFGVKEQRLAGEGTMPSETSVPAGGKGGEEVAPGTKWIWICKRLASRGSLFDGERRSAWRVSPNGV